MQNAGGGSCELGPITTVRDESEAVVQERAKAG